MDITLRSHLSLMVVEIVEHIVLSDFLTEAVEQ